MKSVKRIAAARKKGKRYYPPHKKTPEGPGIIVHIPHSSTDIPEMFLGEFLPEKEELRGELLCMTDWYTDELFSGPGCLAVVHRYSRLVCDPERFLDPEEEMMWQKGMGMYYTRMSDGSRLKRSPFCSREGLRSYGKALQIYRLHHSRLRSAVQYQLSRYGRARLIDGHSFSDTVLPYEPAENHRLCRPDICLGTDPVFTPGALRRAAQEYFAKAGLKVAVNTPFAGTLVPEPFYSQKDKRVQSLMIEVNRSLYMNEKTGEKNASFDEIKDLIHGFLRRAGEDFII